jgi:serine/threonine protein kinase
MRLYILRNTSGWFWSIVLVIIYLWKGLIRRRGIIRLSLQTQTVKGACCSADVCAAVRGSDLHTQGGLRTSVHHYLTPLISRDLKLENILLDKSENVKLGDFGFTREYEPKKLLETWCGTYSYAAPEMIQGEKYAGEGTSLFMRAHE